MNLEELFKEQIDACEPCNGDYLGGKTIEEFINERYNSINDGFVSVSLEEYTRKSIDSINKNILEWKNHVGDKKLYYLLYKHSDDSVMRVEMKPVWQSELSSLSNLTYTDTPLNYPRFKV